MNWPIISTSASSAPELASGVTVHLHIEHGMPSNPTPSQLTVLSEHVVSISSKSKPEPSRPDLTRRAVSQCNRRPDLIDRYLAVHQTLGRGR